MTYKQWCQDASGQLLAVGINSAQLDSELLLASFLKKPREYYLLRPETKLAESEIAALNLLLERRKNNEPLAYIRGYLEFYGLEFRVDPRVLIPRPETEELVSRALSNITEHANILEIGTGSGAIAISLASQRPGLQITATDVSKSALKVAKLNAQNLGAKNIKFIESDLFRSISHKFDQIIANLPYVPTSRNPDSSIKQEPSLALFSGLDGLDHYRKFFAEIKNYMLGDTKILIEAEPDQKEELVKIAQQNQLKLIYNSHFCYEFGKASKTTSSLIS